MRYGLATLLAAAVAAAPILPTAAADLSCAQFTAMDTDGQTKALSEMETTVVGEEKTAGEAAEDKAMAEKKVMPQDLAKACAGNPDMPAEEALESLKMEEQ